MSWSAVLGLPGARPLRPAQDAWCAAVWAQRRRVGPWGPRGAVGLLGCGHGKTLCAQLTPALVGARRPLLLVPASLRGQAARDVAEWRTEYPALHHPPTVVSYEALGHVGATRLLDEHGPDVIIADEAHMLANPDSARWKRLARYLSAHPSCRFYALSGTLTWRGVSQIAHLLHAALRDESPVPSWAVAALSAVVDVGGEPGPVDWATVEELLGRLPVRTKEAARAALHARLVSTPGVVHVPGVAADVSLVVDLARRPLDYPVAAARALDDLSARWRLPDGEELVDAVEIHRATRSLVWGWWSRWADGARQDPAWASWWAARAAWADAVRRGVWAGADSPGVVAELARDGRLATADLVAWAEWSAVRDAGPPREVVWLPEVRAWTVAHLGELARREPRRLAWYSSAAMGAVLREAGYTVHGAGSSPPGPPGRRPSAASWRVHGRGWNGQAWPASVVVETPDSAGEWEQLLARSHRPGQVDDVDVRALVYGVGVEELLRSACAGAQYAADVLGQPQRLTLASWPNGRP